MTRILPRPARLLAAIAAVALLGGVLAGCSARPGRAFVGTYTDVDGQSRTISVSQEDVQTASAELSGIPGLDADAVLKILVSGRLLEGAAGKYGVTVTDDDARAALASLDGSDGSSYSRASVDVARSVLLNQRVQSLDQDRQAALAAEADAVQSSLVGEASPRYTIANREWRVPDAAAATAPPGARTMSTTARAHGGVVPRRLGGPRCSPVVNGAATGDLRPRSGRRRPVV